MANRTRCNQGFLVPVRRGSHACRHDGCWGRVSMIKGRPEAPSATIPPESCYCLCSHWCCLARAQRGLVKGVCCRSSTRFPAFAVCCFLCVTLAPNLSATLAKTVKVPVTASGSMKKHLRCQRRCRSLCGRRPLVGFPSGTFRSHIRVWCAARRVHHRCYYSDVFSVKAVERLVGVSCFAARCSGRTLQLVICDEALFQCSDSVFVVFPRLHFAAPIWSLFHERACVLLLAEACHLDVQRWCAFRLC